MQYVQITANNIDKYLEKYDIIACSIRNSRIKAKHLAIMEVLCCTYPLQSIFIANGPLGQNRGLFRFYIKGIQGCTSELFKKPWLL